ncbi:hypothetical protein GE107_18695 [Cohnella sp. CFH 77786]|uniref:hypothetical protein n=1 Tax=Cohnella sp. CFH 77786 TaxID=2662265 RepID=UPI001C60BFB1|nr:hypothetical protein [Cohnella sp. CFH 77786]MBW5448090.1 hypothetical protein [Cohnella sp. CFH 77786]
MNPEDGYCWSCSHDVGVGIYNSKTNHRNAVKKIYEYLICFLIYLLSNILISMMLSTTLESTPFVFIIEAPFILFLGIPVSALIEWLLEVKKEKISPILSYLLGLSAYIAAGLLLALFLAGLSELIIVLTLCASVSFFFLLRILRDRRAANLVISFVGFAALIALNLVYTSNL